MQSHRQRSLLSLLLTLVLMTSFGCLGLKGASWLVEAFADGLLAGWVPLGSPPAKAVVIQATAPSHVSGKTVVKSADGKFYAYLPGPKSWVETIWPYPEREEPHPECPSFDHARPGLPRAVIDCAGDFTWEWQTTEEFYAVLADGSVWRWRLGIGLLESWLLVLAAAVLGLAAGFFLSRPARKLIWRRKNR